MSIFKKDGEPEEEKKGGKGKLRQAKKTRLIAPQEKEKNERRGEDIDERIKETISQIDIDVPGMVVLHTKEDRHLARLDQDVRAKEEYLRETRMMMKKSEEAAAASGSGGEASRTKETPLPSHLWESGKEILDRLVAKELVTPEQREQVLSLAAERGILIEEALTEAQVITAHDLGTFIAGECKIPFSNLDVLRVSPKVKDVLSREEMMKYRAVPLSKIGATLNIAAVNPLNNPVVQELKLRTGSEVKCIVCTASAFSKTLQTYEE